VAIILAISAMGDALCYEWAPLGDGVFHGNRKPLSRAGLHLWSAGRQAHVILSEVAFLSDLDQIRMGHVVV
jgi:hypothetical protein